MKGHLLGIGALQLFLFQYIKTGKATPDAASSLVADLGSEVSGWHVCRTKKARETQFQDEQSHKQDMKRPGQALLCCLTTIF